MDASGDAAQGDGDTSSQFDATVDATGDGSSEPDAAALEPCPPLGERPRREEPLVIGSAKWSCDVDHVLTGQTIVNDTLTLTPGTRVLGSGTDALVVLKTGRLEALGSAQQPIVFTSEANPNNARVAGGWAGINLLGSAPVAGPAAGQTIPVPPGISGNYGGQDPTHDCGTLKYVRVEFAGATTSGVATPGVLLAGCGTGTDLDYLQVHRAASVGLDVVGGTAALKHVVISSTGAEGLGWRNGWTGAAQFMIVHAAGSSAVIGRHDTFGTTTAPISAPELWNLTLAGPKTNLSAPGITLQSGTRGLLRDSIIQDFLGSCMEATDPVTIVTIPKETNASNTIIWNCGGATSPAFQPTDLATAATQVPVNPGLTQTGASVATAPSFQPPKNSPAFSPNGTENTVPVKSAIAKTSYRGAVGPNDDWTAEWTSYSAQ